MRSVLVLLMAVVSITCAPLSANSQCPDGNPAVTIQIHDYVHLNNESLARARDIVTRAYQNVGVQIVWLGTTQPDASVRTDAPRQEATHPVAQLTINILTPSMAERGGVPSGVLGFVAVPNEGGMGRIGYVVYQHVPEVAAAAQTSEGEILGVIVAHDIRRLILGASAKSDEEVARGERPQRERADPLTLNFSPSEAAQLRARLSSDEASFPGAAVATGGTDPQHQCVTGGTGVRH